MGAELRHAQDLLSRRMFDKYGKLKAAFMARDYNGDGTIGYNDFRQLLRDLGITLPPREFRELVQAYDSDGDKEVSYPEILQRLSTLLSPEGDNIFGFGARAPVATGGTRVLAAEKLLADKMFSKLSAMQHAFRDIDRDGNGFVNQEEMREILRQVGAAPRSEDEFVALWRLFDVNCDGRCSYAEFNTRIGQVLMTTAAENAQAASAECAAAAAADAGASARGLLHPRSFSRLPAAYAPPATRAPPRAVYSRDPLQRTLSAPLPIAPALAPPEAWGESGAGGAPGATMRPLSSTGKRNYTAKRAGEVLLHSLGEAVKARHANLAKMFLLCDERGDGRVSCVQFKRVVAQQLRGASPVDIKLSCRLFGEREFDFGGGQVVLVNYRKFLRHFDCSCHGITQTKTGRRPLTAGTTARSTREFAFCAR